MRFSIALILCFVSFRANAEDVRPVVTIGSGIMFERANDNISESSRIPLSFGAGARWKPWDARLEYASFRTSDGNQTLSVSRSHETVFTWVSYEFLSEEGWAGYVAAALGIGRTNVETRMTPTVEAYNGSWAGVFALAIGLRGAWTSKFAVRPEVRYESADSFKTKDARMGAFVQLDYIF